MGIVEDHDGMLFEDNRVDTDEGLVGLANRLEILIGTTGRGRDLVESISQPVEVRNGKQGQKTFTIENE